jgi:hypothetical protein
MLLGWADSFIAPSVSYALTMQFTNALVYLALAWYFGQLGGDLGASQRFFFPLSPTYWGFGKKKNRESLIEGSLIVVYAFFVNDLDITIHII